MILQISFYSIYNFDRLDTAISEILKISRNQVINLITLNLVKVVSADKEIKVKKSMPLSKFDKVEIYKIDSKNFIQNNNLEGNQQYILEKNKIQLQNLEIEIISENEDFLILNKPKNLVVHSAPSVKDCTLVDYLKFKNYALSNISGEERYGIVHRLDKDTSGAILIAKNNLAHKKFSEMLRNRQMGRLYLCIISKPLKSNCIIECYMGRNPKDRLKMASLDSGEFPNARHSKSEFRKILESKCGNFEIVVARLFTGRTHQIRVHLSTINRFIYGDNLYSPKHLALGYKSKILLHASILYFDSQLFTAKIHKDLVEFMNLHFENYEYLVKKFVLGWLNELGVQKCRDSKSDNKELVKGLGIEELF